MALLGPKERAEPSAQDRLQGLHTVLLPPGLLLNLLSVSRTSSAKGLFRTSWVPGVSWLRKSLAGPSVRGFSHSSLLAPFPDKGPHGVWDAQGHLEHGAQELPGCRATDVETTFQFRGVSSRLRMIDHFSLTVTMPSVYVCMLVCVPFLVLRLSSVMTMESTQLVVNDV